MARGAEKLAEIIPVILDLDNTSVRTPSDSFVRIYILIDFPLYSHLPVPLNFKIRRTQMTYLKPIQIYQQGLNGFAHIVSNTSSLEKVLRIIYKAIKFYSEMYSATGKTIALGFTNLSLQIRNSSEILSSIQSVNLMQGLTCPNRQGLYFFQRMSWQRCAGKIFFLFYSILSNIRLAAKLKFIDLGKISKVAIGHLPIFRLTTGSFYMLYCFCTVGEGIRTKGWFKVTTSIGKIFVTALTLFLQALNIKRSLFILAINGVSCAIDTLCLAKDMEIV